MDRNVVAAGTLAWTAANERSARDGEAYFLALPTRDAWDIADQDFEGHTVLRDLAHDLFDGEPPRGFIAGMRRGIDRLMGAR